MISYNRYFAAKEMWERRHEDVSTDLRALWSQYIAVTGRPPSGDRFPDWVENISHRDGKILISGTSSCRGCTDHDSCYLPAALVFSEDREGWLKNIQASLQKEREAEAERLKAKQEQEERALLATLSAKYR